MEPNKDNTPETTPHSFPAAPTQAPAPAPMTTFAPQAPAAPSPHAVGLDQGPKSYLAMMVLAIFMFPFHIARAYRGDKNGWTRFWVAVGTYASLFIPFLNFVTIFVFFGLCIWGAVDVFKLYKVRDDGEGKPLHTTPRDEKFAKGFYIFFLVGLILNALLIIGMIILMVVSGGALFNYSNNAVPGLNNSQSPSLDEFNSQYR